MKQTFVAERDRVNPEEAPEAEWSRRILSHSVREKQHLGTLKVTKKKLGGSNQQIFFYLALAHFNG